MERKKLRHDLHKQMLTIAVAFVVLLVVVISFVICSGKRLKVYFPNSNQLSKQDITVSFSNDSIVKPTSIKTNDRYIEVQFQALKKGSTKTTVSMKNESSTFELSNQWFGILHDSHTGNFSGWDVASTCAAIFALFCAIICFFEYFKLRKKSVFSYVVIKELGLAIFFGILGLVGVVLMSIYFVDPTYFTLLTIINGFINIMVYFVLATTPVMILFAILLCISNIALIRKEGFRKVNVLGIILSVFIAIGFLFGFVLDLKLTGSVSYAVRQTIINTYFGIYAYFECLMFAVFVMFFDLTRNKVSYNKDYIIILGCAIKEDGTLYPLIQGRVDKAIEFAKAQKEKTGISPKFIPSGGQGSDECISEGRAMANYLLSCGIPEDQILPEEQSTNTMENMRFSKAIAEQEKEDPILAFSTTNYHVFRSGILANKQGMNMEGLGSKTKWYFWPNALIREFIGMIVDDKIGTIIWLLFITLFSIILGFLV